MTRIHCFQHAPFEPPGRIAGWAAEHHFPVTTTRLYENAAPPPTDAYDWLVVMGGPMSVCEDPAPPWLVREMGAVESAIAAGKTVVGVCLGAQIIAHVLGARVYENPVKEIGWFPLTLTEAAARHSLTEEMPESFVAFHWHGETFDVPAGAVHLARSEACAHQMFAYGSNVVSMQFHLEMTPDVISGLADHCAADIVDAPYVQTREEIIGENTHLQSGYDVLDSILDRL